MKAMHGAIILISMLMTACSNPGGGGGRGGAASPGTGGDTTTDPAATDDLVAPTDGIALVVYDAAEVAVVKGDRPGEGWKRVRVWLGIANGLNNAPLPLRTEDFSGVTADGHQYPAIRGCSEWFALVAGAKHSCDVVISIEETATLMSVVYAGNGARTDVSIEPRTCVPCGEECVDPISDDRGATPCGNICAMTHHDILNCGRCGATCGEDAYDCKDGYCISMLDPNESGTMGSCQKVCAEAGQQCSHSIENFPSRDEVREFDCNVGAPEAYTEPYSVVTCACQP